MADASVAQQPGVETARETLQTKASATRSLERVQIPRREAALIEQPHHAYRHRAAAAIF
tara:strand:- start:381 stop:557 length:177 start_codon:yes stop_codon:yes gene_type:complete